MKATARRIGETALELRYRVDGAIDRLRIPVPDAPRRTDGLWRHTCFEAFVAEAGHPGYHEFNFAPSSAWAIYAFDAYRDGMREMESAASPRVSIRREPGRLTLDVWVDLAFLPTLRGATVLRLGLAAVIEDTQGGLSYWALRHPVERPDFHHAEGFALALPAAGPARSARSSARAQAPASARTVIGKPR